MKSAGDVVEILDAFDLIGSLRDAARLAGCSPMTVARYVRLRETGQLPTGRSARRDQLDDPYLAKVEEWVERSHGRVRADVVHDKLRALGFEGPERTTRRAVARAKKAYAAGRPSPSDKGPSVSLTALTQPLTAACGGGGQIRHGAFRSERIASGGSSGFTKRAGIESGELPERLPGRAAGRVSAGGHRHA